MNKEKKLGMKSAILLSAAGICLVSAFVYVYANSGGATIPKVELDTKFQSADLNNDGVLSEAEFAGYLANLRQTKSALMSVSQTPSSNACGESGGCCGGGSTTKVSAGSSHSEGGCCGGGSATKVSASSSHSEGGCCGGM